MHKRVACALVGACLLTPVVASAHVGTRGAGAPPGELRSKLFVQQPLRMAAQQNPEPALAATPRAKCNAQSRPEPGMQGRVPREEVDAGRATPGYWCNITKVGQIGSTGGFKVLRYVDKAGHECAYYDTTLLFPTNVSSLSLEPTGVAVIDMTDPSKPVRTDSLLTPAMQSPHESVNISVERGLLAAVTGNPYAYPGHVDVWDISGDCRHPVLLSSAPGAVFGHESGMAPDGKTFYATSISTGHTTAIDLSDPRFPRPLWVGDYDSHGMSVSDDGNRGYMAAGSGLIIVDFSEIQARKPNPQVREISRLVWSNITIPQIAIPVTIQGKPYVVEVDEFSTDENGGITGHGPRVGAARIIDISDETKPFVVSNIRLEVHQPENRDAIAEDYGAQNIVQGYAAHYCNVPQRREPGIFACSMIISGLRVFDIRDPYKPKEIAYFLGPPSYVSASGSEYIDENANWAMSQPAFAPERNEIWYSDGTSGLYAVRLDDGVMPALPGVSPGCVASTGFASVSVRRVRNGGVALSFTRRARLPVRIDVFQVSQGRRVIGERRVARFNRLTRSVVWRPGRRAGSGHYFARFTMLKGSRAFDTRRVVFARDGAGRIARRSDHYRREACGLLSKFKLGRPVFGGSTSTPLTATYRVRATARVTVTIRRGKAIVKRFPTATRAAGRTHRVTLRSAGLRRGDYTVHLHAVSGEDQASAKLTARRL